MSSISNLHVINFTVNGSITMFQTDYKTADKYGAATSTIDSDEMLAYYLKLYLKKQISLLIGKTQNYSFVSYRGEAFLSSAPFSKYVSDIFQCEVSIRAGMTALRHAILTYFILRGRIKRRKFEREFCDFNETFGTVSKDKLRRPVL